jgi:CDP-diacylglycerol---glycerol-3-phosphate 3-phosphatidyltransferase
MNLIPQAVRDTFTWALTPVVRLLLRMRVRPNVITTLGTVVLVASAVAFALGWVHWGGFLLLCSGLFDMVDGRVAREGGMASTFGAFYDSTLDRVGESALFTGIAVYFLRGGVPPERVTLAVIACTVALAASLLVSYARARAEGLGLSCKVGIAQRAERVLLLGAPTLFFGAGDRGALLFWIIVLLALATSVTVVQRVIYVARATDRSVTGLPPQHREPRPPRPPRPPPAPALHSRKGH